MKQGKLYQNNTDAGFWLKQLNNKMESGRNQHMAPMDLTSSQFEVLIFLMENEGEEVNQIDIEKAMNCSNPTITGIVKRLEAKGFIERVPSQKDKRYKRIVITEKALEMHERGEAGRSKAEEKLLAGFSEEERDNLLDYLKRMIDNVMRDQEGWND